MTVKEYRVNLIEQLSSIYPKTEIDSFFFILMEEYLSLKRIDITLHPDYEIKNTHISTLNTALKRLKNQEPIQYIIGNTEFYGYPFLVDENTLIPRPETEELVEWILEETKKLQSIKGSIPLHILDIGTGTGCIPIALAKNLPTATVFAIDISADALKIAKKNADINTVKITFLQTDILKVNSLDEVLKQLQQNEINFDIIVSNPPYVRELEKAEIQPNVLQNEPHLALFVPDENPLLFYDKIADLAKENLTENGLLFFEINQYLGNETLTMLKEKGFKNIELRKDLFKNDRMIKVQ
ncbi:peptide chain release factor N(5)-glutamine methyltransferase [Polaribacter glomeratus]|uniref:Release factor glutamine methyltransferase n=1 Tax=Polaribacter glomeratus TaxID=102 RepID=A0A2S7X018_9FLAO|nr:peptide chain release factor N(5)-glutamine methyltransferase [Polaribacter glomeratus]PQJ83001.1 protein-(glutamine-N5) methyltransferase, release factor-specific [Polaribacter glomeratus]TXD64552.1 peptide chain release factor N(5)-glutamine methyltransferase [Polaribacter glomeratus]